MELQEKLKMYDEFRHKFWTVEKVKNIVLEDYTNLDKTSFTYDVETWSRPLGSIKGISSFIFGIYERQNKEHRENIRQYIYRDKYAWDKQFGDNEQEVFENVKYWVNKVIENAQVSNFAAIEEIPLYSMYKWKIAFLYQNENNLTVVPIYTYDALRWFLQSIGMYKNGMTMAEMYLAIKNHEKFTSLEEVLEFGVNAWDDYIHFDIEEEKNNIRYNIADENKKRNATSSLELIEYEIKAHKIQRRNPHHQLEKSFRKYLETKISAKDIKQDEAYIDFHFTLNDKKYICELKPSDDQKDILYAIQSAIGQIIKYSFEKEFDYKVIVFQGKPNRENTKFLEYLKAEYNIYYLYEVKEALFKGNCIN